MPKRFTHRPVNMLQLTPSLANASCVQTQQQQWTCQHPHEGRSVQETFLKQHVKTVNVVQIMAMTQEQLQFATSQLYIASSQLVLLAAEFYNVAHKYKLSLLVI
ncbi:TPA: hypothetical protein ACH3X1_006828 [Trebouxia sp. C0004]